MPASATGWDYIPAGTARPVAQPGEFPFAAAFFDHAHIRAQTRGLLDAGGSCLLAWDPDPARLGSFHEKFPHIPLARCWQEILDHPRIRLVAAAAIPSERCRIGLEVLSAGKHYFTDKSPFTTLGQLAAARQMVLTTGCRYYVYYSERLHNEAAWHAGELAAAGALGRILSVILLAPHRLSQNQRPPWFFQKDRYGGILTDIGSHQFEQFLAFTGARAATLTHARTANFNNPGTPGLEDFGEASLVTNTGASCYCRVDWFTPHALPVWGDGRAFITGTEGTLEIRKYIDLAQPGHPDQQLYLATATELRHIDCRGRGHPFFGLLIRDILDGTNLAQSQDHAFLAAELSMQAQALADRTHPHPPEPSISDLASFTNLY